MKANTLSCMLQLIIKDIKATLVSEACFREKELQRTQCKIRTTFYGGLHMSFYMENMILHPFFLRDLAQMEGRNRNLRF